jgi:hypothetical protein
MRQFFFIHQYVQPCLSKNPKYTFYTIKSSLTLAYNNVQYIYNTCALSKHIGNMSMRLRNGGKGEASPSLFPRFAPNTHIYLYASTMHMYCMYPAMMMIKIFEIILCMYLKTISSDVPRFTFVCSIYN